jgi:hypothetical protein
MAEATKALLKIVRSRTRLITVMAATWRKKAQVKKQRPAMNSEAVLVAEMTLAAAAATEELPSARGEAKYLL